MKAIIQLVLTGDDVTLAEAEQFANFIRLAIKMAGGAGPDGRSVEVGQITLKGDDE